MNPRKAGILPPKVQRRNHETSDPDPEVEIRIRLAGRAADHSRCVAEHFDRKHRCLWIPVAVCSEQRPCPQTARGSGVCPRRHSGVRLQCRSPGSHEMTISDTLLIVFSVTVITGLYLLGCYSRKAQHEEATRTDKL